MEANFHATSAKLEIERKKNKEQEGKERNEDQLADGKNNKSQETVMGLTITLEKTWPKSGEETLSVVDEITK